MASLSDFVRWRNTPDGPIPTTVDGTPMTDEELRYWLDREKKWKESAARNAPSGPSPGGRAARVPPGGVPWTQTELDAGLSGAPSSDIPLDAELPVTRSKPEPVDISSVAPDHGLTQVDSGGIVRDPRTGKARRGGAWAAAAPRPPIEFVADEMDEEGIAENERDVAARQDPSARRRPDLERAGWQPVRKQRPDGSEVWVYSTRDQDGHVDSERRDMARRGVPLDGGASTDAGTGRQMSEGMSGGTEFQRERRIQRMADRLGITPEEVEAKMREGGELPRGEMPGAKQKGYNSYAAFDPIRRLINTQRGREEKARSEEARAAIVRNAQWRQNLQEWFRNPTVSEDQKRFASALLLQRGATPNDVDVADGMGFQRGLQTGARQNLNVTDPALQREIMERQRRKDDPAHAGAADIAGGKPDSPEGIAEIDRLAEEMDDTTVGFSWENERALAARLQQPPYNMKKPEAEAAANRAANKRRWPGTRGKPPEATPPGGAAPAAGGERLPSGHPTPPPGAWFPL